MTSAPKPVELPDSPAAGPGPPSFGSPGAASFGGAPKADFIQRLDKDGDSKVSKSEFDGPSEHFGHFDKNGDGYIIESEAPTGPPPARDSERQQRPERMEPDSGNRPDQRPQSGGQRPGQDSRNSPQGRGPQDFIQRLDKDGDGMVSPDEFDGPADHFSHFDTDGDGFIDEDEAPTGPPPQKKKGKSSRSQKGQGRPGSK